MRMTLAALVLLLLAQEKVLFEEKFAKKLSDGWTWTREDKKGWKVTEGALEIRALPGGLKGKENTAKNLLLRTPPAAGTPDEPYALEATVKSAPGQAGEQAGVILYQDDDTYVTFVREHREDGKVALRMIRETGGESMVWAEKELDGDTHAIRLIHFGNKVQAEVMIKPGMWTPAYYGEPPFKGAVKAGLIACGGPGDKERWAKFTQVRFVLPEGRR